MADKITIDLTVDGDLVSECFRIKYERNQPNIVDVAWLTTREVKGKRGEKSHREFIEDGPYYSITLTDDQIQRFDNTLDYCRSIQVHVPPQNSIRPPYLTTYVVKEYHNNDLLRNETIQTYGGESDCVFVDADPEDLTALKLENKPILNFGRFAECAASPFFHKPVPTTYVGIPRDHTPAYYQLHPPPPEPRTLFPQNPSDSPGTKEERNDDLEQVLDGTWQMSVKDDHGPHFRELWLDRKHRFTLSDRPGPDVVPRRRYEGTWECRGERLYLEPDRPDDFDATALIVAHEPLHDPVIRHPAIVLIPPANLAEVAPWQFNAYRCFWKVKHAYADNAFPADEVAKAARTLPPTGTSHPSPDSVPNVPLNPLDKKPDSH